MTVGMTRSSLHRCVQRHGISRELLPIFGDGLKHQAATVWG
jgi:hypothetical protein